MTFVAQHASVCVKSWQLMLQTKLKQIQTYFLIDQKFFIELFVLQSFIYSQTPADPIKVPNASINYPCLQMKECLSIFLGLMNFKALY